MALIASVIFHDLENDGLNLVFVLCENLLNAVLLLIGGINRPIALPIILLDLYPDVRKVVGPLPMVTAELSSRLQVGDLKEADLQEPILVPKIRVLALILWLFAHLLDNIVSVKAR